MYPWLFVRTEQPAWVMPFRVPSFAFDNWYGHSVQAGKHAVCCLYVCMGDRKKKGVRRDKSPKLRNEHDSVDVHEPRPSSTLPPQPVLNARLSQLP